MSTEDSHARPRAGDDGEESLSPGSDGRNSLEQVPTNPVRIQLADNTENDDTDNAFAPTQSWGLNTMDRNRRRVKKTVSTLRRPFSHQKAELDPNDVHLDVLYENQRGMYFFGRPLYSGRALFPKEAPPWADEQYKRSLVNITNAQVPDPSWDWAWRSWYVDMSRDVDEEGWEYSFFFRGFHWHGTSPWFHSFVRRRRWIRLRKRRKEGFLAVQPLEDQLDCHPGNLPEQTVSRTEGDDNGT